MRKLVVFNQVSLDGFFADARGDMSWAHRDDAEWNAFVEKNASGEGVLVFGRKTYDMMASFWPTEMAAKTAPVVAERMNAMQKIVFSRTLKQPTWSNTTALEGNIPELVRKLKAETGPDMAIMGSGTIVSQLAPSGLIDELQLVINPLALGQGRSMFETLASRVSFTLARTRTFQNGNVLLCYSPLPS
jgi:dihydrofolate reductase